MPLQSQSATEGLEDGWSAVYTGTLKKLVQTSMEECRGGSNRTEELSSKNEDKQANSNSSFFYLPFIWAVTKSYLLLIEWIFLQIILQ